jgi:hypothetical protein
VGRERVHGQAVRAAAISLTGRPPDLLLLSHPHPDHYGGAGELPESLYISSAASRAFIAEHGAARLPVLTVEASLTLQGSRRTAEFQVIGRGHSPGHGPVSPLASTVETSQAYLAELFTALEEGLASGEGPAWADRWPITSERAFYNAKPSNPGDGADFTTIGRSPKRTGLS